MPAKTLNVLLIEDSPDYAGLVQHWLSGTREDGAFVLNWTDSLSAGRDRLAQGGVDVVLLDLGLPDSDGVETFLDIRSRAPGIPVIILSAADSESLALQTIQEGAEDYLVKSTCSAEQLVKTLRYAVIRRGKATARTASEQARVIGVVGAKGGVGTTTVACSLAAALRRHTGKEVLLADLDMNSGLASFLIGVDSKYSVLDAIANVDRLDQTCWNALVTHSADGLDVLASPSALDGDEPPADGLKKVLGLIRSYYQWIVTDFGRLNRVALSSVDRIDEFFVVTTPALPALHEAKRVIDALLCAGMDRERLRLIVNHVDDVQTLSGSELKQLFGLRVYASLPPDRQELHEACLKRKLPAEASNVGREIARLAHKVAGLQEKRPKRTLPAFLSFVGRRRKTGEAVPAAQAD